MRADDRASNRLTRIVVFWPASTTALYLTNQIQGDPKFVNITIAVMLGLLFTIVYTVCLSVPKYYIFSLFIAFCLIFLLILFVLVGSAAGGRFSEFRGGSQMFIDGVITARGLIEYSWSIFVLSAVFLLCSLSIELVSKIIAWR